MADEAKPTRTPGARPDRVRLIVLLYRKKGLSIEEFQSAWYALSPDVSFESIYPRFEQHRIPF